MTVQQLLDTLPKSIQHQNSYSPSPDEYFLEIDESRGYSVSYTRMSHGEPITFYSTHETTLVEALGKMYAYLIADSFISPVEKEHQYIIDEVTRLITHNN